MYICLLSVDNSKTNFQIWILFPTMIKKSNIFHQFFKNVTFPNNWWPKLADENLRLFSELVTGEKSFFCEKFFGPKNMSHFADK